MIVFTANNQDYNCPEELSEITFEQYAKYMDICDSAPSLLLELSDMESQLLNVDKLTDEEIEEKIKRVDTLHKRLTTGQGKKDYTEFKIRVVSHFTGLDADIMKGRNGINIDDLNTLFNVIQNALEIKNEGKEIIDTLTINGIDYNIADGGSMTLGEFLEGAQIEELNNRLGKKQYETMIDLAAILLRRTNEEYSDAVFERNRKDFANLDMATVSKIAFFFHKKNEQQLQIATLSFLQEQVENLKAARQNALDGILSLQA